MNPNGKAVGIGLVISGWEQPVREIVEWLIHGIATNQWDAFPELATSNLTMAVLVAVVYRTWSQSKRQMPASERAK